MHVGVDWQLLPKTVQNWRKNANAEIKKTRHDLIRRLSAQGPIHLAVIDETHSCSNEILTARFSGHAPSLARILLQLSEK